MTRGTRAIFWALALAGVLVTGVWIALTLHTPSDETTASNVPIREPSPRAIPAEEASPRPILEPVVGSPNRPATATLAPTATSEPTPTPTLYVISDIEIVRQPAARSTSDPDEQAPLPKATGRIEIPALGHDHPIVPVSWRMKVVDGQQVAMWDVAEGAVGHHRGSAPLGEPGNSVLTGHTRGDGMGEFQNLWDLQEGQEIRVHDADGSLFVFRVESVKVIQEVGLTLEERYENAKYMAPTNDTRLTLVTCWPEWVYTHRVIVIAKPS